MIRLAFKEAMVDTTVATIINFPINFGLLLLAIEMGLTPMGTTILLTSAFFTIAVFRKTFFRVYFHRRHYQ